MTEAIVLDDAGNINALRTQLIQAPTAFAKLEAAKAILAAREEAAKPAPLVANDVAVPLEPLLVEWTPRFSSSIPPEFRTLPRRNQHLLFRTGVDLSMMQLTASATFEGEKSPGADRAASDIAKIKACEAAGYKRMRVKLAGFNTLGFVFVKDGLAVTPEGAAKLAGLEAPAPAVSRVRVTKTEARAAYDDLDYSATSYQQHHDSELLRVDLSQSLLPRIAAVKELMQRGWPEDATGDPQSLLNKAQGIIDRQERLKADGLTSDMGRGEAGDYLRAKGLDPDQVSAILATPTSIRTSGVHEVPQYTIAYLNQSIETALTPAPTPDPQPIPDQVPEPVPTVPAENDLTRLNALKRLAPKGSITSDDPQALEKLRAKLAALMAEQEFMKKANKFVKSGNDAGLLAMGLTQVLIEGLKKPDFAGRIGFADYMLSNNNGVIGTTRKRIAALEAEEARDRAAQEAELAQQAKGDQMQDQDVQGTNAVVGGGSRRWLVTNMLGYKAEHQADTMVEAIQQAMNGSDYTLPSRDWNAVEITGGERADPAPSAETTADPLILADQSYLQSIIDGTIDLLDPGIYDRLEPLFAKYADDAAMMGLLNQAAESYTAAAVAAAKGA